MEAEQGLGLREAGHIDPRLLQKFPFYYRNRAHETALAMAKIETRTEAPVFFPEKRLKDSHLFHQSPGWTMLVPSTIYIYKFDWIDYFTKVPLCSNLHGTYNSISLAPRTPPDTGRAH